MLSILPDATVSLSAVFKRAALIFLPIAATLSLIIVAAIGVDGRVRRDMMEVREKSRVELASEEITRDFNEVGADLRVIANLPSLTHYLDTGSAVSRDQLARLFWLLSREKRRYDQIRYLDIRGREVIRINFDSDAPLIVSERELQDKSKRYYFRESIKLGRNELYVSRFDLNIEQGKVETPYKPTIRFATPVFDSAGRKKGVLVINYLGTELIDRFREIMQGGERRPMLIDPEGYWLVNSDSGHEWGFMLGRTDLTFEHDFPQEWRTISTRESGRLLSERGMFIYSTVYPLLSKPGALSVAEKRIARDYRWKVVSFIPGSVLSGLSFFKQETIRMMVGAVYLLLALAAWIIAQTTLSRRQAQTAVSASHARYDELARSIPVGVYQFRFHSDGSYKFDYISPVFCEILGVHAALALADAGSVFHAAHPDDIESLIKSNREAAKTLAPFRWEGRFIVRGETRWLRIASDPAQHGSWGSLWSGVVTDITERKELERELEHQAHVDMLTGLSNRRHFFELAERELSRARRHHQTFSVLMLDIDYFKQVNDTYGHDVGDMALGRMGEICTGALRGNDILARLGGEEFVILLPETKLKQALETADRLRQRVANSAMEVPGGKVFHLTVSIGVAQLEDADGNVDSILKRADNALYVSKKSGRNRACAE